MSPSRRMARKFLDIDTASKICVGAGSGNLDPPVPKVCGENSWRWRLWRRWKRFKVALSFELEQSVGMKVVRPTSRWH
eukprot:6372696-Ditylum_brightwellii.AAC.1